MKYIKIKKNRKINGGSFGNKNNIGTKNYKLIEIAEEDL